MSQFGSFVNHKMNHFGVFFILVSKTAVFCHWYCVLMFLFDRNLFTFYSLVQRTITGRGIMDAEVDFQVISTPEFTALAEKIWPDKPIAAISRDVAKNFYRATPLGKGLYKLRMPIPGRGKRGGARVIFMCITKEREILLLTAYKKARMENLTEAQQKTLARLGSTILDEGDWKNGQTNFRVIIARVKTGAGLQKGGPAATSVPRKD